MCCNVGKKLETAIWFISKYDGKVEISSRKIFKDVIIGAT